jgi:cardiolipin synthase (CMP-forming)
MKNKYLTVPNILSASRLILLPVLFLVLDYPVTFLICYAILGSTDFFDGIIARKFNQMTEIGKSLDSLADIFFYVATAYFIYRLYPEYLEPNLVLLYIFFSVLILSFVISAVRIKKPVLMHTFLLKACAVFVYFLVLLSHFFDTTYFITFILFTYYLGFLEEILIFLIYGDVDPDTLTILKLRK